MSSLNLIVEAKWDLNKQKFTQALGQLVMASVDKPDAFRVLLSNYPISKNDFKYLEALVISGICETKPGVFRLYFCPKQHHALKKELDKCASSMVYLNSGGNNNEFTNSRGNGVVG